MHNDKVQIEFDPATARANLAKHKVGFAHAEQVLCDPSAVTIEVQMRRGSDDSSPWEWMRLDESWSLFTPHEEIVSE